MAVLVLGAAGTLEAQPIPKAPAVAVRLSVTGEGGVREGVTRCLTEELGSLEGVTISTSDAALTLDVIATPFRMSNGQLIGYMIYAGGYQPGPKCGSPQKGESLHPVTIQWQVMRMAPPDLEAACRKIVAEFETEVIEPTRKVMKRAEDLPR